MLTLQSEFEVNVFINSITLAWQYTQIQTQAFFHRQSSKIGIGSFFSQYDLGPSFSSRFSHNSQLSSGTGQNHKA